MDGEAGLLDGGPPVRPERNIFWSDRAPWFTEVDALPKFSEGGDSTMVEDNAAWKVMERPERTEVETLRMLAGDPADPEPRSGRCQMVDEIPRGDPSTVTTPWDHNAFTIAQAESTAAEGCEFVNEWLRGHNWRMNPEFMTLVQQDEKAPQPLILLARAGGKVIGGLFAQTQVAWLRISIMAVDPERRSQGIGAALLAEAETRAKLRDCTYAYVDTMEYQAPAFYQARGYQVAGQLPNWDSHGHSKFHLYKELHP